MNLLLDHSRPKAFKAALETQKKGSRDLNSSKRVNELDLLTKTENFEPLQQIAD